LAEPDEALIPLDLDDDLRCPGIAAAGPPQRRFEWDVDGSDWFINESHRADAGKPFNGSTASSAASAGAPVIGQRLDA
jgi:hypothetical protein